MRWVTAYPRCQIRPSPMVNAGTLAGIAPSSACWVHGKRSLRTLRLGERFKGHSGTAAIPAQLGGTLESGPSPSSHLAIAQTPHGLLGSDRLRLMGAVSPTGY